MKILYEHIVDKIMYSIIESKLISAEDADAYRFGTEVTLLKSIHFVSYLIMAVYMRKTFEFFVIFAVFILFRRNTGGFHAQTRIGCFFFSCTMVFLSLFATELNISWWVAATISIIDIIVLLKLSPIQNSNRNLDSEDIVCFRHRLRILSVIFSVVYIATLGLRGKYFIALYTIGLTMDTLLTILGKLQSIKQS